MLDRDVGGPDNQFASKEVTRAVSRVSALVPQGSAVTVEGTPLYAGQLWDESHEFGLNGLLALQMLSLRDRGHVPVHIAMIDDFTTGKSADEDYFRRQMREPPYLTLYESDFEAQAEGHIQRLRDARRTMPIMGELLLLGGSQPHLKVRSGRVSCELLDACFQLTKGSGTHIIIHPTNFVSQQRGMREILEAINGGQLPGDFINVFFKRNVLSRILFTDPYGRSRNI